MGYFSYNLHLIPINVSDLSTGMSISARPNKIVAGLDVAKTNELLQTIAKALEKNVRIFLLI